MILAFFLGVLLFLVSLIYLMSLHNKRRLVSTIKSSSNILEIFERLHISEHEKELLSRELLEILKVTKKGGNHINIRGVTITGGKNEIEKIELIQKLNHNININHEDQK